jgi:molybdopterin molybdotransferase
MTTYDEAVNTILRHTHALEIGEVLFSRIATGPGASAAFGVIDNPSQSGAKTEKPVFALSGPPSGALINCETLVRPAVLKMRGIMDVRHPTILAEAADSVSRKMPKAFVRWARLTRNGRGYRVTLNPTEGTGPLAVMAAANSLTIIPERTSVKAGDGIEVLPLDWMGIQSLA